MPTPAQYLTSSYKKQVLELVPVSVTGTSATFQVVYGGTPLPDVNRLTGIAYTVSPLASGVNISLVNPDNYESLYDLDLPSAAANNTGTVTLTAVGTSFNGRFPNLATLPGPILEFSLPYASGPLALEITNTATGYTGVLEYSDDPRFPSLVKATTSGATASNSIGADGDKLDYFSLVVPSGTSFDSLILAGLAGTGSANYTIYQSGSVESNSNVVAAGQLSSDTAGQNLLTAGTTKTQALAPGTYTIKIENQSPQEIAYQLDFGSYISLPQLTGSEDTQLSISLPATTSGNIPLSWQANGLPAGLTLQTSNGLSRLTGQTEQNFNGVKLFNLTATENNTAAKQTSYTDLRLTIAPVNDGPTLSTIQPLTGGVEDTVKLITYDELAAAANEADIDGDILSFRVEAISSGTRSLKKSTDSGWLDVQVGANGTLLSPGDTLQWLPAANANGSLNAFTVTAVDAALASSPPIQVVINTAAVNDTPTDLTLSTRNFSENIAAGATVASLTSNDPDASDTFTYALVAGSNSTDNAAFTLAGNQLKINASPDFETKSSYNIRLRTTDAAGLAFETPITLSVNNLNEAPTNLSLTTSSFNENIDAGATIASLTSNDPDASDTFTYALVAGSDSTDNAAFTLAGNQLKINASPDFETKSSYNIRLRTTDAAGLAFETPITLSVNNLNEAPTNLSLTTSSFNENIAAGATVASLTSNDPDTSDTFTYALVAGTNSTDNAAFTLAGNQLKISASADFETKSSYNIRLRTTDAAGLTFETPIILSVNDLNDAPTLTAISTLTGATEDVFKEITYADLAAAANEADVDNSNLSFRIEAVSAGTLQKWNAGSSVWESAQAGITVIAPDDKLQWKGAQDANGELNAFTVKAWDGTLASSSAVQVKVNVNAVNDAPTLTAVSTLTGATEDVFKEITYTDLAAAANEADVDSSNLSFRIEALSTGTLQKWNAGSSVWESAQAGITLIAPGDKLQWKGAQDANGELNAFTVKAWDGTLASNTAIPVKVTTTAVDDAPRLLAAGPTFAIRENQPFTTAFEPVNVDPTDAVTLSLEGSDANAFSITQTGQITLKQPGDYETKQTYAVTVRATDTTGAQLSTSSSLSLSILDQPDQILTLTPQSLAFVPTLDTRITLNASYEQDAPLPGDSAPTSFTAVLSYDGASLDLAPSTVSQSGISLTNNDAGSTGLSALTITAANASQVSSFKLDFDVTPGAVGPFAFSWSLAGASGYEQQTNSPITISPDAEAFISNGVLNLSAFQTPLRISTQTKQVFLVEQQNIALPYQQNISRLVATNADDQISVAQSLTLDAAAGNDTVDLSPLPQVSQPIAVNVRLGAGRDTLVLPASPPASTSQIQIDDFQLGFDRLQLSPGTVVNRRSDVLAVADDPQAVLRQSAVNLRFAAIATDLDPGLKTLVSAQSSIVPSSIALDPGSDGRQLRLNLAGAAQARIVDPAPTSLPAGYSWAVAADRATAILTLPAQFSLLTGLADLRRAVAALVAEAPAKTQANLQLQWLDAQGVILSSLDSVVEVTPQVIGGGSTPIKLDFVAPNSVTASPAQLEGSDGGDTIQLISAATDQRTDKVFGGIGNDVLIAGDGDRLIGGAGADTLIAIRGLGSTQLSGGAGNDLLLGGSNDALVGGDGDDILVVRGLGNRLIGGSGTDLFVLADGAFGSFSSTSSTPNRILDFGKADQLAFNVLGLQRNDFTIVDSAAGAIIRISESWSSRLGTSDLAILQGVKANAIQESQILINQSQAAIATSTLSRVDVLDQAV